MGSAGTTAVLAAMLAGCAASVPEDAYSVDEVIVDITSSNSELDGEVVAVHGWLGECGGLDCGIYPSLKDARIVAGQSSDNPEWMASMDRRLAIGGGEDFDLIASTMQFSEVVVYGEINAAWKAPPDESGTQYMCMDRCDDIRPRSIRKSIF